MRLLTLILVALVLALPASAARSGSLALVSETLRKNPNNPVNCLGEDDYDQRLFSGALNGSYSTNYRLCDINNDGLTAGGIGLESDVSLRGALTDITITAPDGSAHHALPTGRKGNLYRYAVCYVPPYYIATDIGTDPLQGGIWTITLSGDLRTSDFWITRAQMTDVNFQRAFCPASQQNLR